MAPFKQRRFCPELAGGARRRHVSHSNSASYIVAVLGVIGALLAVGWSVARTLDSSLLAVVASGMLFLIAVSVRGIGQSGRR